MSLLCQVAADDEWRQIVLRVHGFVCDMALILNRSGIRLLIAAACVGGSWTVLSINNVQPTLSRYSVCD
jgi:hypothetical protein